MSAQHDQLRPWGASRDGFAAEGGPRPADAEAAVDGEPGDGDGEDEPGDGDGDGDEPGEPGELPSREEAHLYLQLQRFSFCLERHAARRADAPLSDATGADLVTRIGHEIDALDAYSDEQFPEQDLPIALLRRRFALDDNAIHLLIAAAAPAIDLSLARRLAAITGRPQPDAGLLVATTTRDLASERSALAALRATAPLVRHRLLRFGTSADWSPETPLLHRPVVVPERVIDWLRGDTAFDAERFERAAELWTAAPAQPSALPPAPVPASTPAPTTTTEPADPIARALFRRDGVRRLPLVVVGPALSGKAAAVLAAAAARGLAVLDVDLEAVAASAQPVELLLDLAREALLHDAVLLLRRGDGLRDRAELRRAIAGVLGDGARWTALTSRGEWRDDARRLGGALLVEIDLPGAAEQAEIWHHALPAGAPCEPDLVVADLGSRYRLTPGDILAAGDDAIRRAAQRGPDARISLDDVEHAIRIRLRDRLGDAAELMATPLGWEDLVVSDRVAQQIFELLASVRHRTQVIEKWGFGRALAAGRAVTALLSGPRGTGKTLVAALLAKDLGLELFRVDLARAVAQWPTDLEDNLARVFDEAANARAVVLLDDADALSARRTAARAMAQRLDRFDGVVMFATSEPARIDDALRARIGVHIELLAPDAAERAQLWQAMLPPEVPVAHDLDFADLAQRYAMTGRYIKSAVVRAAYLAAGEQLPGLTNDVLRRAAQLEWDALNGVSDAKP